MAKNTEEIECPVRGTAVPVLTCHSCPNCLRVLFRSEYPPEVQCMAWRRWLDPEARKEEDGKRARTGWKPDRPTGRSGPASLEGTWPGK